MPPSARRKSYLIAIVMAALACLQWSKTAVLASTHVTSGAQSALVRDVEFLASDALNGRATGSEGNAKARNFIVERLQKLGASPLIGEQLIVPFALGSADMEFGYNVVASFPGQGGGGDSIGHTLILTAHYDHLGVRGGQIYNGADDNASGVSVLLDIARRLSSGPIEAHVVLAFLDAEEIGLKGAQALVKELEPQIAEIALNINLDMVGRSDGGALFVAGTSHSAHLRPPLEKIASSSKLRLRFGHDSGGGKDDWTYASDHAAFHQAGVPFLYFGVEDHADYHRPTDDSERIDFEFLEAVSDLVWQTIATFDGLGALRPVAADEN